jgi:hypothetical protein
LSIVVTSEVGKSWRSGLEDLFACVGQVREGFRHERVPDVCVAVRGPLAPLADDICAELARIGLHASFDS